jgi:hypothetical protein
MCIAMYSNWAGYVKESEVLSILRKRIYLIDDVAVGFQSPPARSPTGVSEVAD